MPKSRKKFIDKKDSVTFRLVHRSQQDPLAADETAPQRVLQPVDDKSKKEQEKRIEEQHKFGIYYDDDYNYLQHLRETSSGKDVEWEEVIKIPAQKSQKTIEPKIMLPSSVFASDVEEKVGLLNKAAVESGLRLDLDPDVIAAMDEDFDYSDPENELEDNFMELANGPCSDIEEEDEDEDENELSSDGNFEVSDGDDDLEGFKNDRTIRFGGPANTVKSMGNKSRFTEYSHTSNKPDRPETLKHLDARFEKFYEQYDDDQIGALEDEEIEGHIDLNSDIMLQLVEDFESQQKKEQLPNQDPDLKQIILQRAQTIETKPEEFEYVTLKKKPEFDCETILSTYSNIYNRPKLIDTSLPKKEKRIKEFHEKNESDEDSSSCSSNGESVMSKLSTISIRPKNETPEERRERKANFKAYKKEKRQEKKMIRQGFLDEKKTRIAVDINKAKNQGKRLV